MADFLTYIENLDFFAIIDIIAIFAVATLVLLFFKRHNSIKLAVFVAIYFLIFVGVFITNAFSESKILYITLKILQGVGLFLLIGFCVVYQQDLKIICAKLSKLGEKQYNFTDTDDDLRLAASEIVKACQTMSKNDIGALIVIAKSSVPDHILETGTALNAQISSGLLQSVFNTKAPLHDGAVVIKNTIILSAGCFLPISQRTDINKELGTRHRAAVGLTEETDVLCIVVSEETGIISVVNRGEIKRYMTPEKLLEEIENAYGITYINRKTKKRKTND